MAVLAHRLALEDFFAELQHTGFFGGGRCLSAGRPHVSREPQEACCGGNQSPAAAYACSALFQNCSDHSDTPDPALANRPWQTAAFHAWQQIASEAISPGASARTLRAGPNQSARRLFTTRSPAHRS